MPILSTEVGPALFDKLSKNDRGGCSGCHVTHKPTNSCASEKHDVDDVSPDVESLLLPQKSHTWAALLFSCVKKRQCNDIGPLYCMLRDLCLIRAEFRDKLVNVVEHLPAISRYILQASVETKASTHAHQCFLLMTIFLRVLAFHAEIFGEPLPGWRYSDAQFSVFMCRQEDWGCSACFLCFGQRGLTVEVISATVALACAWQPASVFSYRWCGRELFWNIKSVFIRISVYKVQKTELIKIENSSNICQAGTITAPAWLIMLLLKCQRCVYSLFQLPSSGPRKSAFEDIMVIGVNV